MLTLKLNLQQNGEQQSSGKKKNLKKKHKEKKSCMNISNSELSCLAGCTINQKVNS